MARVPHASPEPSSECEGQLRVRIAIMQPTYLPWAGYFDLMDQVDQFVLLDTVQFDKRSWQQRNRIKTGAGLLMLTVPVKTKGRFDQAIKSVEISEPAFALDHVKTITHAYTRAPYLETYQADLASALRGAAETGQLARLTTEMIGWLRTRIGIATPCVLASELGVEGKRSALLAAICEKLGARQYLSPPGAAGYLVDEISVFRTRTIDVFIQDYHPHPYSQLHGAFLPYASALDILLNCGPETLGVIRAGRKPSVPLVEWAARHPAQSQQSLPT